jgi:CheY-like chemotaxis protein
LAQYGIEGLEKRRHDKEFDVALVDLKMPKDDFSKLKTPILRKSSNKSLFQSMMKRSAISKPYQQKMEFRIKI